MQESGISFILSRYGTFSGPRRTGYVIAATFECASIVMSHKSPGRRVAPLRDVFVDHVVTQRSILFFLFPSRLQPIRVHRSLQIYVRDLQSGIFPHIPSFMAPFSLVVLLYASARVALAHVLPRQIGNAFFDPTHGGGSWLDNAGDGLGEPLNVIHSFSGCYSLRATTIY
jgi:hypothetical protein